MTTLNYIDFKIVITNNYKLKCYSIDSEDKETFIQITNEERDEYTPIINFENSFISICQEGKEESFDFIQKWIENPEDFTEKKISFQNKEFQVLPEVLFALIISDFKKRIEKNNIINDTVVEIPSRDCLIAERVRTSLESIGLRNIFINPFSYDYTKQSEQLIELLEMKNNSDKNKTMMERAKIIDPKSKEKIENIQHKIIDESMSKYFSLEERKKLKLVQLDNYCLFIASRYLETVEDHINLVFVSKRLEKNMEKFHYNPTSVNQKTMTFFPNIETLHTYNRNDEFLTGNRITNYIDWVERSYFESRPSNFHNFNVEWKTIVWSFSDTESTFKGVYNQNKKIYFCSRRCKNN